MSCDCYYFSMVLPHGAVGWSTVCDCGIFLIGVAGLFGSVVVDSLFIVTPIVGVCNCSMFCCALPCVLSNFAIILMRNRELVALLSLSAWCLVIVVWLFHTMPWVCLQFVIVVSPDHTHLLFLQLYL